MTTGSGARWYWLATADGRPIAHREDCRRGSRVPVAQRAGADELPAGVVWHLPAWAVCSPCWAREEREGAARLDAYLAAQR